MVAIELFNREVYKIFRICILGELMKKRRLSNQLKALFDNSELNLKTGTNASLINCYRFDFNRMIFSYYESLRVLRNDLNIRINDPILQQERNNTHMSLCIPYLYIAKFIVELLVKNLAISIISDEKDIKLEGNINNITDNIDYIIDIYKKENDLHFKTHDFFSLWNNTLKNKISKYIAISESDLKSITNVLRSIYNLYDLSETRYPSKGKNKNNIEFNYIQLYDLIENLYSIFEDICKVFLVKADNRCENIDKDTKEIVDRTIWKKWRDE